MQLTITASSGIPIYKQVYEQVERMILNGQIEGGNLLPSVRQIAIALEVNPMTISKAYGLLEERGLLLRQRGKGMLVIERDKGVVEKEKMRILNKMIENLLVEAQQMGIKSEILTPLLNKKISQQSQSSIVKASKE